MMKSTLKLVISSIFLLVSIPIFLLYKLVSLIGNKDETFAAYAQLYSLIPGKVGSYARIGFYRLAMTGCDKDVRISFGCLFSHIDTVIEEGTYIGPSCNIGMSRIAKNTLLGSNVHILSGKNQHNFTDMNIPIRHQGGIFEQVNIGQNCWIGNNSTIMANIGNNTIVGAGSVVINDLPEGVIAVGNPAKVIKQREA